MSALFHGQKDKEKEKMKRIISIVLAAVLVFAALSVSAFAMTAPEEWLASYGGRTKTAGKMLVTPGKNENALNFTWFSYAANEKLEYRPAGASDDSVSVRSSVSVSIGSGFKHTVKLADLQPGKYTYTFTTNGKMSAEKEFTVADTSDGYTVMYCSDPQLGRSGKKNSDTSVANDGYGWEKTVVEAVNKGAGLIVSGGDQINEGLSQKQMNVLLSADKLDSIPFAGAPGNHDFYSPLYSRYFSEMGENGAGNDRYFLHGETLFIIIDALNMSGAAHEATINNAVSAYPDAKWRIAVLHMSAYSPDEDEASNKLATRALTPLFEKYQMDLVLSGHDHFYSRTAPTKNGKPADGGTVYLQAGSASGGKCGHMSVDGKDYIEFSYDVPSGDASYSLLRFDGDSLTVSSYITGNEEPFDEFSLSARSERSNSSSLSFFAKIIKVLVDIINTVKALFR